MIEISKHHRELLTRLAFGENVSTQGIFLPEGVIQVLAKIQNLQRDLKQDNVHAAIKGMYQTLINPSIDRSLSDLELLHVIRNENDLYKAQVMQSKLQQAILQNHNNPTFDWSTLLGELNQYQATNADTRGIKFVHDLSFEEADVVGTHGYDLLDHLISGGLTKGSYTIFYGGVGMGKSTLVTIPLALGAVKAGKKPVIVSLEGNEMGTIVKLAQQAAGLCGIDQRFLTAEQKQIIKDTARKLPPIPIVPCGASKRYELDRIAREHKPDVLIYDQITLGSKSREWMDMANTSQMLQRFALETGIPVVALTQSDKKFSSGEGKEEDQDNEDIKYSASIRQDATTVIRISHCFPEAKNMRLLTIEKTKDDSLSPRLPIKVKVEWSQKGVDDLGLFENRKFTSKMDYMLANKRDFSAIEVAPEIEEIKEVVKEVKPSKFGNLKTELGTFEIPLDNLHGDYNQSRYETTGERLKMIGESICIKELGEIGDGFNTIKKNSHDKLFVGAVQVDGAKYKRFVAGYYFKGGYSD